MYLSPWTEKKINKLTEESKKSGRFDLYQGRPKDSFRGTSVKRDVAGRSGLIDCA